jgi:hypothetical protein
MIGSKHDRQASGLAEKTDRVGTLPINNAINRRLLRRVLPRPTESGEV